MNIDTCIKEICGTGIALESNDIDTDRIIPARFLKELSFSNLGENVFCDERKQAKNNNQLHPFDELLRSNAKILTVAKNFGCGSSREHAPQALKRWGIDAVVGESFGEIFRGNCASIGLACLTVSEEDAFQLRNYVKKHHSENIKISLMDKTISFGEHKTEFSISESIRERLITGRWNILAELLENKDNSYFVYKQLPYINGLWK